MQVLLRELRPGDKFQSVVGLPLETYIVLKPHRGLRGAVGGSILVASLTSGHTYPGKPDHAVVKV